MISFAGKQILAGKGSRSAGDHRLAEREQQIENRDQVIGELTIANPGAPRARKVTISHHGCKLDAARFPSDMENE